MNAVEKFDLDGSDLTESLDFRNLVASALPSEIEAACKYEYMRESQTLRHAVSKPKSELGQRLPHLFGAHLAFRQLGFLMLALGKAGFPNPWKRVTEDSQRHLISLIAEWKTETMHGQKESGIPPLHPPVVIEKASIEFDSVGNTADQPYHWRLEPSEPNLLQKWEQSDRKYFFGFIRIDEGYNETDACNAFRRWFAKQYEKSPQGNLHFAGKLKQLAAMRVRHHYPRGEREKILVEVTGKKTYKRMIDKVGIATDKADVGLSRDCSEALGFFQSMFPDEEPIHFPSCKS